MARPRVVVVGAGLAGLWCARTVRNGSVDVILLDRRNHHTFFPLFYQGAAAELVPTDIGRSAALGFGTGPSSS